MKEKDFAAMIVAYNEEEIIGGCLLGLSEIYSYVVISKPWNGVHTRFDKTGEIAKNLGAEVIYKDFKTETEERNFIMEKAENDGYKYVFVIDADEFYRKEDLRKAMNFIKTTKAKRYNIDSSVYFWKNQNWEIIPRYTKTIPVCCRSDVRFERLRKPNVDIEDSVLLPNDVVLYHFSFVEPDRRILNKLEHFSHAAEMNKNWFEDVWKKWTPDMEDIHPGSNKHAFKKAIPYQCPEDIKMRYLKRYD